MRGTQELERKERAKERIIPAYAGNTTHPYAFNDGNQGSSPRMRGTPP